MQPLYSVQPLSSDRVDQAHTVIRLLEPGLELDRWRCLCRATLACSDAGAPDVPRPEAILLCVDPQGYIRGLAAYRVADAPAHGRTVTVSTFIAASTLDPAGVAAALLRDLARIVREQRCAGLEISLPEDETWSRRFLAERGFAPSAGGLYRAAGDGACA
jgi:hypothetical protein